MIVTCEQCATQFQLDDSKVPPDGIRVRCSRCKCAFFVESPQRRDADRASELARDSLTPDPAATPAPSVPPATPVAPAASATPAVSGEAADSTSESSSLEEDESDWQFKEDIAPQPEPEPDPAANDLAVAREAVDDMLGSGFTESLAADIASDVGTTLGGSDLDIDCPDSGPEEPGPGEQLPEHDDDPNAVTIDRSPVFDESVDTPPPTTSESADAPPPAAEPAPLPPVDTTDTVERAEVFGDPPADLGSPEDWDFFADEDAPTTSGEGRPSAAIASEVDLGIERAGDFALDEGCDDADLALETDVEDSAGSLWISRTRNGLGWALVGFLCVYAGVVGLGSRLWSSPLVDGGSVAGFEVGSIEGRWVENAVAGPIYVISGELRTGSSTQPTTGMLLRIRPLDASGAPIAAESAAVGPPVPLQRVREWDLRDLRDVQEMGALQMANRPAQTGQARHFTAILGNLPETVAAYDFQVVAATSPTPRAAERAYPLDGFAGEGSTE